MIMTWVKDKVFPSGAEFVKWLETNLGSYIKAHISQVHMHHTWKPNHGNYPKYSTLQLHKNMRSYHVNSRKWDDIGQHLTIGKEGYVVLGRRIDSAPASAFEHNGNSSWHPFMFEMIGDFDKGQDKLEGPQLATVLAIVRYMQSKGKPLKFHREMDPHKSCPGTGIDKNDFLKLVNKLEEEDDMLENAIVILSEADFPAASQLALKLKAPIYMRGTAVGQKVAKTVYVVGGTKENIKGDKVIVLSGDNRFQTWDAVGKLLK